jgi:hypothetical protein
LISDVRSWGSLICRNHHLAIIPAHFYFLNFKLSLLRGSILPIYTSTRHPCHVILHSKYFSPPSKNQKHLMALLRICNILFLSHLTSNYKHMQLSPWSTAFLAMSILSSIFVICHSSIMSTILKIQHWFIIRTRDRVYPWNQINHVKVKQKVSFHGGLIVLFDMNEILCMWCMIFFKIFFYLY